MSRLSALLCESDDVCQWFAPLSMQRLLHHGQRQRIRQTALALSELMTIIVYCPRSHSRDFQHYYTAEVEGHLRPYFPGLGSYSRFVALMPRAVVPGCGYLHTRKGRCTGITCVDATSLAVCHNRRISRPKVFDGYATRGKSSMRWYLGFQLHFMVKAQGELWAFRVPTGEVEDREPVWQRAEELGGPLDGARGYSSKALHAALMAHGLPLITRLRRTMKPRLMRLWDRWMLRQRFLLETINDQLKNISQIEHSRHRSRTGFMVHLVGGWIAYTFQPKKPSLGLWCGESGLPVVV